MHSMHEQIPQRKDASDSDSLTEFASETCAPAVASHSSLAGQREENSGEDSDDDEEKDEEEVSDRLSRTRSPPKS